MVLPVLPPMALPWASGNASGATAPPPLVLLFTTLRPVDRGARTPPSNASTTGGGAASGVAASPPVEDALPPLADVEARVVGACQANAVRALVALRATGVQLLVFTTDPRTQRWLTHVGAAWSSEHRENEFGLPFVGSMWAVAEQQRAASGAPFIGYANGDILFGPDLPNTVAALGVHVREGNVRPHAMLIGLRRNAYVHRFPAVVAEVRAAATRG